MAFDPTIIRASSMTSNIWLMPLWISPSNQPRAGSVAPSVTSQVAETLTPIFFSTPVT